MQTLEILKQSHNNRKIMSDKMRYIGCPQTRVQKLQLLKLIKYFNN